TLSTAGINFWIDRQAAVEALLPGAPAGLLYYRWLEALLLLAPPLLPLGQLFPLVLSCSPRTARDPGAAMGRYYLVNTAGSVAGSLLAGFVGLSGVGANGCAAILALACAAMAIVLLLVDRAVPAPRQGRAAWIAGVAGLATVAMLSPWRPLRLNEP